MLSSIEDVIKSIQGNLKLKTRELKKLLKEYDQIGMSNNEEEEIVEEQNLVDAAIAQIKEEIVQLGKKLEIATEGMPFKRDDDETAADFCDEYCYEFNEMNKISGSIDFKMSSLSKLYHPNGEMNIIGYKTFTGRDSIMECLYEKFNGLDVKQKILSIRCDPEPPKYCDIYIDFKSLITIENDRPRKVLQTFALVRSAEASSSSSSSSPPVVGLGPEYLIVRELFLVQDSRPLYHYPEVDLFALPKSKPSEELVVLTGDADTATASNSYDNEDDDNEDDIVEDGLEEAIVAQPPSSPVEEEKPEEIIQIRRMGMS